MIQETSQLAIKFPILLPKSEATIIIEYDLKYTKELLNNFGALFVNKNEGNCW